MRFYPEVVLASTDVLATLSPLSRLCFQSSMEAKDDIVDYINNFDGLEDYLTQLGTSALAHYFTLKDTINKFTYALNELHNSTDAAFHAGSFIMTLFFFEPAQRPTPQFFNFEELVLDEEPMYYDDGTKVALSNQIENSYEAIYTFLTTLNFAEGVNLDSCKYYAGRVAEKIYDGKSIFQKGTPANKAEGVFTIIDSFLFFKGAVMFCVNTASDIVGSC